MSDYEQQDNTGVLFKNDKQGNDKRPDYTGRVMVDGKTLRIAAWIKEGKKGKFMSLKFSEMQERGDDRQGGHPDDDIPF